MFCLLQCAIPVFEHLLPAPHNERISTILFEFATWHSLAKLRLHTDATISLLEASTKRLGQYARQFLATTCQAFRTVELPHEETARRKRTLPVDPKGKNRASSDNEPKVKKLNLNTYKWHALGDYPAAIRRYGTTDNYSTQIVSYTYIFPNASIFNSQGELEHWRVKKFYRVSSKSNFTEGIAKRQLRLPWGISFDFQLTSHISYLPHGVLALRDA